MSDADSFDATPVYAEEWRVKLQEELDQPNKWENICNVEYTNSRVIHNPYLTDAVVSSLSRGTAYTMRPVVQTDESATIETGLVQPQFIDRGDLYQCTYVNQMYLAQRQAVLIKEEIEKAMYTAGATCTDFGTEDLAGSTGSTAITVAIANIDDIIRTVKQRIFEANGELLMNRNGLFFVWRPADFNILESYAQANGFVMADAFLRSGTAQGFEYMGVTHYTSNLLTSGHVFAGVKKALYLGILSGTWGDIMVNPYDPGQVSGISVVSRADYKFKIWTKVSALLYDINVS